MKWCVFLSLLTDNGKTESAMHDAHAIAACWHSNLQILMRLPGSGDAAQGKLSHGAVVDVVQTHRRICEAT